MKKIKVMHFMRKSRLGFNFSIEQIFFGLRQLLKDKVEFAVLYCGKYNDGYFSKIYNIIEAAFRQKNNAIAHITGETHFLNLLMSKRNVLLTIHDCRFMQRKSGIQKKIVGWLYLKAPVKKAAYITTVSAATKQDVINYTGCDAEKITVIPVYVNNIFKPVTKSFNASCPVILQVGAGENKNLDRLVEAIKGLSCKLVIVGEPGHLILKKLAAYSILHSIKKKLSAENLYTEYINCDIVSFVSTFEGFGMPIVEANCVERVVITSNISSMPEVAGDAACLVDPFDIENIRNGFLKIITDNNYREQIIANGRRNRERFNEKVIANAYYDLYKKIASGFNT